jgi:acyl transferase domain-containing protein
MHVNPVDELEWCRDAGGEQVSNADGYSGNERQGIAFINMEEALEAWEHVINLKVDQVAVVRALKLDVNEPLRHPMLKNITPWRKTFNGYPEHAVAVVAMACRTAAGNTPDELWRLIQSVKSTVREIDATRFPGEVAALTTASKGKLFGNLLSDIEQFDHKFFSKSKREAAALDPHQRLLLETTYQALEAAGWVNDEPERHDSSINRHTTGCFIGITGPEYFLNLASHAPSPYVGTGMLRSFNAGRLSHYFGWTGPSHTLDTACSSAMVAIHQACRALQLGECTRAIAGGVNLIPNLALSEAMRVGGFLSETGPCKTFDAQADGYCRGEAVGIVVLKPLHMALQDGDDIQGVLLATGNNQNINNTSITNPVLESQIALYRDVLKRASVHPSDISYIETHGTGTRAGDPVEVEGIRKILGRSNRQSILHIGAVKPISAILKEPLV